MFLTIFCLLGLYITSEICGAQEIKREGKFEFHGILRSSGDVKSKDTQEDSRYKVKGSLTDGFGVGYNISDFLNLNANFLFGSTDGELTDLSGSSFLEANPDIFNWDVNLDYNIIKESFTPVLTAGIGEINYECFVNTTHEKIDDTSSVYNIGGGFRWGRYFIENDI